MSLLYCFFPTSICLSNLLQTIQLDFWFFTQGHYHITCKAQRLKLHHQGSTPTKNRMNCWTNIDVEQFILPPGSHQGLCCALEHNASWTKVAFLLMEPIAYWEAKLVWSFLFHSLLAGWLNKWFILSDLFCVFNGD